MPLSSICQALLWRSRHSRDGDTTEPPVELRDVGEFEQSEDGICGDEVGDDEEATETQAAANGESTADTETHVCKICTTEYWPAHKQLTGKAPID